MIEKMEKTPTGWGEGYKGANFVACRKLSPKERPTASQSIDCKLSNDKEIHLYGSEVHFNNIDSVKIRDIIFANNKDLSPISCYVDSGIITCYSEERK